MKILTAIRITFFLAVSFFTFSTAFAIASKPRISDQDVLSLFKKKQPINNRTISAQAIEGVLTWAQDEASAGRADQLSSLNIADSVITGVIALAGLRTTPLANLPPDLQEHLKDSERDEVAVIPVEIDISGSVFESVQSFNEAIFQQSIGFTSSTFKESANFGDSIFLGNAYFTDTSFQDAEFGRAQFLGEGLFAGAQFNGRSHFVRVTFNKGGSFNGSHFHLRADFAGTNALNKRLFFTKVTFDEAVSFVQANIDGEISFNQSDFPTTAYFNEINLKLEFKDKGILVFKDLSFKGRAYFSGTHIKRLWFSIVPAGGGLYKEVQRPLEWNPFTPVIFEKYATFRGLDSVNAGFKDVEFRDFVDFGEAKFKSSVNFADATFEKDASFYRTEFPLVSNPLTPEPLSSNSPDLPGGLILDNVRFQKPVEFEWGQLNERINTKEKGTFELLENTFKQNGNLEGQNAAMYQRRLLERSSARGWDKLLNSVDLSFWGYGVRPLRVGLWILLFCIFFTGLYWANPRAITLDRSKWWGLRDKITLVVGFSARTSWKLLYGYQNARTPAFKALALIQSIGFKVLIFFLLKAFSNTSPLLNELVGKLVKM